MKKKPQISATYDEMFEHGGFENVFELPYKLSCYYPMYRAVKRLLTKNKVSNVLEVGCGTGAFAHMIFEKTNIKYKGFDFSHIAIEKSIIRTNKPENFYVGDALDFKNYTPKAGAIICTEVLEHIPNDLDLIQKWPPGTLCICSVPNFDSIYHERYFHTEEEVIDRYGKIIRIDSIKRIKKPVLTNISLYNRVRHLRWNRYDLKRIMEIVGLGKFSIVKGWFLFVGKRLQ